MHTIVVIGGVAAGTSAASQAKRRQPDAEVILLERGPNVSYGACGMPYNLQEPRRPIEDLIALSAERFRSERRIDVRLRHEVTAIDPAQKRLRVRDRAQQRDYEQPFDRLVVCTGARATRLDLPGSDLPGVFHLRELTDGAALKRRLAEHRPKSAIVIGGGYIGLEMVETFRARGLAVRLIEKGPDVAPGFDPRITELVREELVRHEVDVDLGCELEAIERAGDSLRVRTDRGAFEGDLVLVAVGIQPNVELAKAAGIALGKSGAIAVDAEQRTNLDGVWAAGDCAEARHRVTGEPTWIPLGPTANKQGKIAGANAAGAHDRFEGIVGSAVFKVFDLQVARTGLGPRELEKAEIDALSSVSTQPSRAGSVAGAEPIRTLLIAAPDSGRLLGVQMAGRDGVGQRIDVFATALHANMTIDQLEDLDLAYAPPFAPVYDPILIAATVAKKDREKRATAT